MSLNNMIREALEEFDGKIITAGYIVPNLYGRVHFDMSGFDGLQDVQGKPYGLRAHIPVRFDGTSRDDLELVIIGFGPNQGTGDFSDYEGLEDNERRRLLPQQTPRIIKEGVTGEIMLPLVDLNGHYGEQIGSTSLDYITLAPGKRNPYLPTQITHDFGKHDGTFEGQFDPQIPSTYFHDGSQEFGNPHAIYNPKSFDQVAGFLTFKKGN